MYALNSFPDTNLFSSDLKLLPMSMKEGLSQYGNVINYLQKLLFDKLNRRKVNHDRYLTAIIFIDLNAKIGLNTYPFRN